MSTILDMFLILQAAVWNFLSRNHHISGRTRIQAKGVDFKQVL